MSGELPGDLAESSGRRFAGVGFAAVAAAGVLLLYLIHPLINGFRFPIGPDGPVYTWLARLAEVAGFGDAPGGGPGVPGVTLVLSSLLGTEPVETVMLLGPVLAASCGLAAGALVERALGPDRLRTAAAVGMTSAFSAYLAGGWLANLAMAAVFLAAVAALARAPSSWRSVWAGAVLLAAAGLTHRVFASIGAAVLLAAAAWQAIRSERPGSALRLGAAAVGGTSGALLVGAWISAGGAVPGDTSQDGFFRRVGLRALLLDRYRERIVGDVARASVPIAAGVALASRWRSDRRDEEGGYAAFLREVLAAWAILTAGGLILLLATGWGPPYRLVQFAFFLPLAAAGGLAVLARGSRARAVGGAVLAGAFVGASMIGWFRQAPAFSPEEIGASARAGAVLSSLPPGTPLVFLVDTDEPAAAYHVARSWNVIRMGVPAERIPDVRLAVGSPEDLLAGEPTLTGDLEHDRISTVYIREVRPLLGDPAVLVLRRFNPEGFEEAMEEGVEVAEGVAALSRASEMDPAGAEHIRAPEGLGVLEVTLLPAAALVILGLLGWGWSRWILQGATLRAVTLAAPSIGLAAAILSTVAVDRTGLLPGSIGALVGVGAVGALGYAMAARD